MMRLAVALGLVVLAVLGGLGLHAVRDGHQFVEAPRLQAALLTFRPTGRAGSAKPVDAEGLAPDRSTRAEPDRCRALALLNPGGALDGGTWQGINGEPAQPVTTLSARFASAGDARAALRAKRVALLRCGSLRLTFPPFDEPAEAFAVRGRLQLTIAAGDTLTYTLVGERASYSFYLRRYANTLTWTYGANESEPAVRQEVVDDLARRLAEMATEE